jgi:hypothetical protein
MADQKDNVGLAGIKKLKGRANYPDWCTAMESYLDLEDLWDAVEGKETDAKKVKKAKAKIILCIEETNFVHIRDCKTAKEVWDSLKTTFEDTGLSNKISLLRTLITTRLEACANVEEYVNKIVSTAHKLNSLKLTVSDEWIGCILLAGLPEIYKPMIMGIESSGVKITADSIKTKILTRVLKVKKKRHVKVFLCKKN